MNLKATIFLKAFCFAALFCFFCGATFAQSETMTKSFTSNGTWEVPLGVDTLTIECIGGGGAGGYVHGVFPSPYFRQSGGGGGGAYAMKKVAVTPGSIVGVTVGNGGQALATDGNQHDGGDSYVTINSVLTVKAAGGKTVKGTNTTAGGEGGSIGNSMGAQVYAGGKGGNGEAPGLGIQNAGGGGGAAGSEGPGKAGGVSDGGGATNQYGGAGGNSRSTIGQGRAGGNYGGGGSGSKCTGIGGEYGGEGAKGYVIITYQAHAVLEVDDMADTVCSGASFTVTPTGTIPVGTTYSWSAPSVAGISGTTSGSGASNISGTLTNSTINDIDVVYNVTASFSSYTDNFTVTITVRGIVNAGIIGDKIISCSAGDTLKSIISTTDASGNGQYSWESSTNGSTWNVIPNATDKEYTPSYAGFLGKTYYRRLFVSQCQTVYSNIDTVNYPGNVSPGEVTSTQPKKYCKDSTIVATLNANATVASGASYTTQWQSSTDGGTTWTNITGETNNTFNVHITGFTTPISYRYTIKLPGCDSVPSNNQWDYTLHTNPIAKLTVSDTCPENTAFYISADITPGDAPVTLYKWNSSVSYGTYSADTIYKGSFTPACGELYQSTLMVKDTNGCVSDTAKLFFHTPTKPTISILSVPAAITSSSSICKSVIPNLKDTIAAAFHSDCEFIIPATYTQDSVPGTEIALGTTVPVTAIYKTVCNTSKNDTLVINIVAPTSLPALTPADIIFDDSNDTINLYYGICDTLYYVNKPTYSVASGSPFNISDLTLSNDKSSANEGPILGYITGGEYTIVWSLSSACGDTLKYTKKYIVMYPPCGGTMTVDDADGITYQTVRVGCECWTKPNLKTITGVTGNSYVYQEKNANIEKFGRLYSWYSAVGLPENSTNAPDTTTDPQSHLKYIKGICPAGWGLPTTASFESLYHAAENDVTNLKSSDATVWLSGMTGTDATGFTAVAAGYYMGTSPYYYDILGEAFFWTCEGTPTEAKGKCCSITLTCPTLLFNTVESGKGFSVRCVKRSNN